MAVLAHDVAHHIGPCLIQTIEGGMVQQAADSRHATSSAVAVLSEHLEPVWAPKRPTSARS